MKTLLIFTLLKVLIFTAGNVILEYRLLSYHNWNNQTVDTNNITHCCNQTEPVSRCISPCTPSVVLTISDRNSTQYNGELENLPRMTAVNFTNLSRSAVVVNLSYWNFMHSRINILVYNENRSSIIIEDSTAKYSSPENAERKVTDHIDTLENRRISAKIKLAWILYNDKVLTPTIVEGKDKLCCENGFLNCMDNYNRKNCSNYCQISIKRKCYISPSEVDDSNQERICEATAHSSCSKNGKLVCRDRFHGPGCSIKCKNITHGYCTNSDLICKDLYFGYDCSVFCTNGICILNRNSKKMKRFVTVFVEINRTTSFPDIVLGQCTYSLVRNNSDVLVAAPCETKQLGVYLDDWKVSDEIKFQVTSHRNILISIQLVCNNTKPEDNMYSSKVHRSIFNSTFFDGTLIQFKSWVYYTSILNNDPISSSYLSTNITNTQTPDMTVLSTYTDTSSTEPYLTTKLLSNTEIMTSSLQPTTVFNTKDELISKDFNSTIDKKSRITKSFQATSFIDLSTTELQMSSQLVQISFDYTTRLSYETVEKISSTAWSSNTHNVRSTHRLLHSDNQYSSKIFMLNNSQHSTHSLDSVLLQSTLSYEQKSSVRTILGPLSFDSNSTMNDYEASKLSMTNMSPHSKEYGSVIMQSSAYELKSSVHTILSSSQKFVTNPVNTISTLIVSVSSPRQTTIYSSSLKATKAAPTTPKMVITTSFIVPRRTTSTVSPIISTSNNDPTTGIKNESTLKNWMKDNMLLVLGISIGVAVVLVVVVIILIVRRKKSNKPQPRPELDPSDLFINRRVTLLLGPDDELMPDMQPAVTHSNPLYSSEFVERKHSNYTGNRDSHFC